GFLKQKELVVHKIEHAIYGVPLEKGLLKLQSSCAVIKDGAVRQYQTNLSVLRHVMGRLPYERGRNLFVRDRALVIGAPFRSRRVRNRITAPGRIAYDQVGISEIVWPFGEEIGAPDIPFDLHLPPSIRVVDKSRKFVSVLLKFLNVARRELIEIGEVETERCNPACRGIDIHAPQAAQNLAKFSRAPVISGLGIRSLPFLRHAVEHAHEKNPRATSGIEAAQVKQRR